MLSRLVAFGTLAATAQFARAMNEADDDPGLSQRDNYGLGFGISGGLLATVMLLTWIVYYKKRDDTWVCRSALIGTVTAIVAGATKSWHIDQNADPVIRFSLWDACVGSNDPFAGDWTCIRYDSSASPASPELLRKSRGALALLIIGLVFALFTAVLAKISSKKPLLASVLRTVGLLFSFLSFATLICAWAIGHSMQKNIENQIGYFPYLGYSNGIAIIAWNVMLFTTGLLMLAKWGPAPEKEEEGEIIEVEAAPKYAVVTIIAVVAAIIAVATTHWFTIYNNGGGAVYTHVGLRGYCSAGNGCGDLPTDELKDKGKTALGLTIIGLVLAFLGALLGIGAGRNAAKAKGFKIGFVVLTFFAGASQMVGWASAQSMIKDLEDFGASAHVAWSNGLAILSWILLFLVTIGLIANLVCSGKKCAKAEAPKSPEGQHAEGVELTKADAAKVDAESKPATV